ncbi:strictosidine-O-beta-D-glucosidase-like [Bidens hawaiensis]|uniref:strictosidine-O-beta-D-glucosidase-like n=1 Tax=Bidens hawaiensis TaxID=980011 RepID=UPI004049F889
MTYKNINIKKVQEELEKAVDDEVIRQTLSLIALHYIVCPAPGFKNGIQTFFKGDGIDKNLGGCVLFLQLYCMNKIMEALNISEINDDVIKEFRQNWMINHAPERTRKKYLAEKICKDLKHISYHIKAGLEKVELGLPLELDIFNEKSSTSAHTWNIGEASTSRESDVVIFDTDIQMLEPEKWLNDRHMNFYLQNIFWVECISKNGAISDYHLANTIFYLKLKDILSPKEDVQLLKKMGVNAYRFSISWSRILPGELIDELLANDIDPFVTLFHWDTPIALEEEYKGFLSSKIVDDFVNYVDVCFWEFGDRVKNWVTLNEPRTFVYVGYVQGIFAPGRGGKSQEGNPQVEPYIVAYNLLNSHAAAYRLYEETYKVISFCQFSNNLLRKGSYVIINSVSRGNALYILPSSDPTIALLLVGYAEYDDDDDDDDEIPIIFMCAYNHYTLKFFNMLYIYLDTHFRFLEPLTKGCWPKNMQILATTATPDYPNGRVLPKFSIEQQKKLISSYDFLGINYYFASFAKYQEPSNEIPQGYSTDCHFKQLGINWNCLDCLQNIIVCLVQIFVLTYFHYCNIMEDVDTYLGVLCYSNKVNVKGYFIWSFMDSFEWMSGYNIRFGMIYVDYAKDLQRYPKNSAVWLRKFLCEDQKVSVKKSEQGIEVDGASTVTEHTSEVSQKMKMHSKT